MKRILMTKTEKGSMDGINLLTFEKGLEYDVSDLLADAFKNHLFCAVDPYSEIEIPKIEIPKIEIPEAELKIEIPEFKSSKRKPKNG